MIPDVEGFPHLEPELLVANFSADGKSLYRNDPWERVLGVDWSRLAAEEQSRASQYVMEAAGGSLVTNEFFLAVSGSGKDPIPVLLNFLPVHALGDDRKLRVDAVTVAGEVLREPATWTQSQTQRNRLETLGRMTMGIAHDFNNLLSGILGYTELLKSYAEQEREDPILVDHLRTIEQAALDGAALIRKIQQYIRQEKQTHFTPLDVATLIQDCIVLTRPYWYNEPRRLGISISVKEDFQEVPPVMGAATELREVFLNLILNAVQAMPKGGSLTFKTELTDAGVRVTVSDTGLGMSDNVRQHIFEPLYTTKGDRGTGMGLAVSYGIIQEHEGTIRVETGLGVGSTFVMVFPPAEEASPERNFEPEKKQGRPARILVVDDERMVRTILVKLLSLKGHDVEQAASGSEALSIIESQEFDVVFTDLGMPEMNGRQLARALRRKCPELPIVLLTGDTNVGEPGEDVDAVLAKPFKIDHLEATIQDLIREESQDIEHR